MSASLVGSEMCIRDSISPEGILDALREMGSPKDGAKVAQSLLHPPLSKSCLLYTSDAADDM
eukprot:3671833-Alexandrium_andersonii.AAC.1